MHTTRRWHSSKSSEIFVYNGVSSRYVFFFLSIHDFHDASKDGRGVYVFMGKTFVFIALRECNAVDGVFSDRFEHGQRNGADMSTGHSFMDEGND